MDKERERIIGEVKGLADKLGHTPRRREFLKAFNTPASQINKYFGGWNNLLEEAGFTLNHRILTDEELKQSVLDYYKEYDRIPMQSEFEKNPKYPSASAVSRRLGLSWTEVLIEVGLKPHSTQFMFEKWDNLSDEEFIEIVKDNLSKIEKEVKNDVISKTLYDEKRSVDAPNSTYILKRTQKEWNTAIQELGFKHWSSRITNIDEIKDFVFKYMEGNNETPSLKTLSENGYSAAVIRKRFGNYNNFLRSINVPTVFELSEVNYTDDELLDMYKELANKMGVTPSSHDVDTHFDFSNDIFVSRFGSMYDLQIAAGLEPLRAKLTSYDKEDCRKALLYINNKYGEVPNNELRELLKEHKLPSLSTVMRRFKTTSMKKIWDEVLK